MKWNIIFVVTGPSGRVVEAPNTTNPVEAETMDEILQSLAQGLPFSGVVTVVGLRIDRVDIDPDKIEGPAPAGKAADSGA